MKDHLGNVRVTFKKGTDNLASKIQDNFYYPFGLRINNGIEAGIGNKYLYNGKELVGDDLGLSWYDYGARWYDPQLGRWHVVDPLDEFYSPYVYVGNNPICFIDPDGMGSDDPPEGWGGIILPGVVSYLATNPFTSLFKLNNLKMGGDLKVQDIHDRTFLKAVNETVGSLAMMNDWTQYGLSKFEGSSISFVTPLGKTRTISKTSALSLMKKITWGSFFVDAGLNFLMYTTGEQSGTELFRNTAVSLVIIGMGGIEGAALGTAYLLLDAAGAFDHVGIYQAPFAVPASTQVSLSGATQIFNYPVSKPIPSLRQARR